MYKRELHHRKLNNHIFNKIFTFINNAYNLEEIVLYFSTSTYWQLIDLGFGF